MHLLTAQAGGIEDGSQPVDLGQSPGDVVILTSADTEIVGLARAHAARIGNGRLANAGAQAVPSLRLANLLQLTNNFSIDLYVEKTLSRAKLIIIRVLGGPGYWRYGLDEVRRVARGNGIPLAVVSGAAYPDPVLENYCTLPGETCDRIWSYLVEGGPENFANLLRYCDSIISSANPSEGETRDTAPRIAQPAPLPKAGIYDRSGDQTSFEALSASWRRESATIAIVFYRALFQGGDLAPVDALIDALAERGLNALPVFVASPKDGVAGERLRHWLQEADPDAVINLTAFAVSQPGDDWSGTALDSTGAPVIQAVLAGADFESWQGNTRGLTARDIAMHVALPEVDGRIISRAISFKAMKAWDAGAEVNLVGHAPVHDRIAAVADLAANWSRLRRTPVPERRIGLVLSNYPSTDGQIANGVGLDTPAGTFEIMQAMAAAGYYLQRVPADGAALVEDLKRGPTNVGVTGRLIRHVLPLSSYLSCFEALPDELRSAVTARWGAPQDDPMFLPDSSAFAIAAVSYGNVVLALQPGRGAGLDPRVAHHDQTITPPHAYLAFYAWLRRDFEAHAVVHIGKHGNLEWLPGKALALSASCWPDAILGAMPHVYPFIVNDPGEGTQAKRRTGAVIVDHLTPPLARAESYGPLKDLEALVDEYYEASGVDQRRLRILGSRIIDLARASGLDQDCGIAREDGEADALAKLDNFLCDLKEMQIRDGLHVFGRSPTDAQEEALLVALTRAPRGDGLGRHASFTRALAHDLGLEDFDPLDCRYADAWTGPRPDHLATVASGLWRSHGDTVERIELLAAALVGGRVACAPGWTATRAVLEGIETHLRPAVASCGRAETAGVMRALDGRFVPPGPAGAPTRGRHDVLPTGRNFYSIDTRTVPTEAAWTLGQRSADLLVTAYMQEHGAWPERMALSAWGTANMRSGGDDIAQAMALIGVQPTWDATSRRVSGYEVIPLSKLKRPRVDVIFRISGLFRDAFPAQIDLLDTAFRAVAALDEPADANPLAARVRREQAALDAAGMSAVDSERIAGARVFGNRPGEYGAGLKDVIQAGAWTDRRDLAQAYRQASDHAYTAGGVQEAAPKQFADLLARTDAVVQNQDAREFDILDSADFFQFEGGLAAAIEEVRGARPAVYHNDTSRPELPVVRRLEEEIARVVRARAANPKWIDGVMRHGYKGASEIAATVTNLLGFAATTGLVSDHQFELLFDSYLIDERVREFMASANPHALEEMAERFREAISRGLWQPRRNSVHGYLDELISGQARLVASTDGRLESGKLHATAQ